VKYPYWLTAGLLGIALVIIMLISGCSSSPSGSTILTLSPPMLTTGKGCYHTGPGWITLYADTGHREPFSVTRVDDSFLCGPNPAYDTQTFAIFPVGKPPFVYYSETGYNFTKTKPA
jgi:hypothetical protein